VAVYQDHLSVANKLLDQQDEINRMRGQIAEVRKLHREFEIFDECGHDEHDDEGDVIEVDVVGAVCRDGYQYSICRACCAPNDSQTVVCADDHDHAECWPCPTFRAVADPTPQDPTKETPNR
jgi:hypothetical protein